MTRIMNNDIDKHLKEAEINCNLDTFWLNLYKKPNKSTKKAEIVNKIAKRPKNLSKLFTWR